MVKPGNIDLNHRPIITNKDGSKSTIFSVTIPLDKNGKPWNGDYDKAPLYALVPSIANGKFLTKDGKMPPFADQSDSSLTAPQRKQKQRELEQLTDAATEHYQQTGQYLGIFSSGDAADTYAGHTHAYVPDGTARKVYVPSY